MHQPLFEVLKPAMFAACQASLAKRASEQFYCVALYTSGEYSYLLDSFATDQGLMQVAKKYLTEKRYQDDWGNIDVAKRELRWSPCDSPYHGEFSEMFTEVNAVLSSIWGKRHDCSDAVYMETCNEIHDTCVRVLAEVRNSQMFKNESVIFNLLMGDQSDEERFLNADELNSPVVLARFRNELILNDERLKVLREYRWSI